MKIKKILANIKVNSKIYSMTSLALIFMGSIVMGAMMGLLSPFADQINAMDASGTVIVGFTLAIPSLVAIWLTAMPIFRYFEKLSFDKVSKNVTKRTEKALTEESVIGKKVAKTASK